MYFVECLERAWRDTSARVIVVHLRSETGKWGAKNFNLIVNSPLALSRISQRARNSGGTTVPTEFRRVIVTKLQLEKEVELTENRHVAVFCALPPEPSLDP